MLKIHQWLKRTILSIVDFFYPPFKGIMPLQTFRYAACGGANMCLSIFIFFISFHFVLHEQIVHTPFIAISGHIAALIISFCLTFPIGFYLSMFVVFPHSYLPRRIQLFRYFVVAIICIILNYALLNLFVVQFQWYPTPSQIVTTVMVVTFSYLSQRYFSFRK